MLFNELMHGGDPPGGKGEKLYKWGLKKIEDIFNPFVKVSTGIAAPFANQINVILNEGIHEGSAYDRSLNIFYPVELDLENYALIKRADLMNPHLTYTQGKELMQATTDIHLNIIPIKPTGNLVKDFLIGSVIKEPIKNIRDNVVIPYKHD